MDTRNCRFRRTPAGGHRMDGEALHIWPRGEYMLIALPNDDGSFTATLFLPKRGPVSFESLTETAAIERFLADNFPDVRELMPDSSGNSRAIPSDFSAPCPRTHGRIGAWPR